MSARTLSILATALLLAGCGQSDTPPAAESQSSSAPAPALRGGGTFAKFAPDGAATVYNAELLPAGSAAEAVVTAADTGVRTELKVTGLLPNRAYGAHAHVKPCGEKGDAAGPHFQDKADPVTPSVDPAYANAKNEIWLDFTTDATGGATATSTVDWKLTDRKPASVVIHEKATQTHAGHAGTAGARLGCIILK
ncbi:superoxide dismutase, Cu-Zn family [Actinokineospora alba]|uniref:Superoxide dismutase, Cu-Zn family n=1 Tax=Actinokineospora alba TaxID=504798 RepID=A0A1H0R1R4_9PSEU|nr:superoxide dismutase family protein [Actinokineospora alba]TDP70308.1 Cu-Zn family superoxide dismutase [Actinokineospora alba]SDI34486.1 superoxide dismutase, Cu-Zn family [Actinokineospora alba]SDP22938.1 superoxide dismutase, Cu-Zn family [Actinokineospora alba]